MQSAAQSLIKSPSMKTTEAINENETEKLSNNNKNDRGLGVEV